MKVVEFTGPAAGGSSTRVVRVEAPVPSAGHLSVAVEYAAVNFVDVMARRGDAPYVRSWPYRPGMEVVGRVLATGSPDSSFALGDRVASFTAGGGLAEVVVVDERLTTRVPADVPGPAAAVAPLTMATAVLLLDAAHFRPGETVLMHGANSAIGRAVAQLVPALGGGLLIGTVTDPVKAPDALAAGWTHVNVRDADLPARIHRLSPGGADVVLDPLGTTVVDLDLACAASRGRVVLFGNPDGRRPGELPTLPALMSGNVSVGGFSISSLASSSPSTVRIAMERVLDLMSEELVRFPTVVVDGLDRVVDAHDALSGRRSEGKYVVRI